MAGALVFLVGQLFLFGTTRAQCPTPCEDCKIIPEGKYEGTWYLKSAVDSRCPDMCLYQKTTNGAEKEMCFCDPGPIEYEICKRVLVVTGGDRRSFVINGGDPQLFNSSEIIHYGDVCSYPNIPPLPKKTSAGKSVGFKNSSLMFCGGSQIYVAGEPNSDGWGATDRCWKYSQGDQDWTSAHTSNMNFNRSWFSLNNINNNTNEAVAAGGLDYNGTVWDTLEKYSGGLWNLMTIKLDNPTYGHCAVHYSVGGNSYLMIIGGSNSFDHYWNASKSVTQIDLLTGDKVSVDPGPLPALWAPACTIHGEDIYVSGGGIRDGNQSDAIPTTGVYRFNLKEGHFTLQGNVTTPRWGATMGVLEGQLVVAGGYNANANDPNYLASIESSGDDGATWVTWKKTLSQGVEYQAMASVTFKCQ